MEFSERRLVLNSLVCSGIVLAGQDTTASSLTRLMCLMAENPDLQARLRTEILDARAVSISSPYQVPSLLNDTLFLKSKDGEELSYKELSELPLLDGVCREVLRLFAPITFVWRQLVQVHILNPPPL